MELLKIIFKPIFYFILFISFFFLLNLIQNVNRYNSFTKNIFEVSINDKLLNCYYTEIYNNTFLISGTNKGYNHIEQTNNKINNNHKFYLKINEYEVYHTNGVRIRENDSWKREYNHIYKEVTNHNLTLQIKRKNEILYEGIFISDISKYLTENGRYYFHIYSTRKDNFISSVKTHISFNIVIS